jgi:hypothetical protein
MKNLEKENVFTDYGEISVDYIKSLERDMNIKLPEKYVQFIIKYNGAHLNTDAFDYNDPNISTRKNRGSIAFEKAETIRSTIDLIQSGEEPDWPTNYRFENGLIPFGDNGGGDLICFDYRNDRTTDNPHIVIWYHEGPDYNPVFIANNFEEFINMLHEPED